MLNLNGHLTLIDAPQIAGPPPSVPAELICKALNKMKGGKAAGPSGICC